MKNFMFLKQSLPFILFTMVSITIFLGCTKYTTNNSSKNNTTGSGSGLPGPLPAFGGNGNNSGSGIGNSGGGMVNPNIPQAYIQALLLSGISSSYITFNDSVSLKQDGSYTSVYFGNAYLKYKVGIGSITDPIYSSGYYFLKPYCYYSYVIYKTPDIASGETLLYNDLTNINIGKAQVRFVCFDQNTTSAIPMAFNLSNYADNIAIKNRYYIDHKFDSTLLRFTEISAGNSSISFVYKDSNILSFQYLFESGKKYTVFANASRYNNIPKGRYPEYYYNVARHN